MSPIELNKNDRDFIERTQIFHWTALSVFVTIVLYLAVHTVLGARLSQITFLTGIFVFSPLIYFLDRAGHTRLARNFLCISCNIYIFLPSLNLHHQIASEYFYFCSAMLPFLVLSQVRVLEAVLHLGLPIALWISTRFYSAQVLPADWYPKEFPAETMRFGNFISAYILSLVFVGIFIRANIRLRAIMLEQSQRARGVLEDSNLKLTLSERSLVEAQDVAAIGNWSFITQTQKAKWSKQMYKMFPDKENGEEPDWKKHLAAIHSEDQPGLRLAIRSCLSFGTPFQLRYRVNHSNKMIWVETRGKSRFNSEGRVVEIYGTTQDITEVMLLEERLAAERAANLHRAKLASLGEMAAGIAHEINNPLAIVHGKSAQLHRKILLGKICPEDMASELQKISSVSERIAAIIQGLRSFSRNADLDEPTPCLLTTIVQDTIILCGERFKAQNVELKVDPIPAVSFLGRPPQIAQVLLNLLNNAFDAVSEDSDTETPWIRLSFEETGSNVIVRVTDSGHGIPEEIAQKIMQPFFTTKAIGQGTGLGLSISMGIIESHKGRLFLDSGQANTTFVFELPLC